MEAEYPGAVWSQSPNHSSRKGAVIDKVVIHITDGSPSLSGCVERFQKAETKASPHFVIGRDGTVVQLVELSRAAWHAKGWNAESVGIEHVCRSPNELKGWAKLSRETRRKLVECDEDADRGEQRSGADADRGADCGVGGAGAVAVREAGAADGLSTRCRALRVADDDARGLRARRRRRGGFLWPWGRIMDIPSIESSLCSGSGG